VFTASHLLYYYWRYMTYSSTVSGYVIYTICACWFVPSTWWSLLHCCIMLLFVSIHLLWHSCGWLHIISKFHTHNGDDTLPRTKGIVPSILHNSFLRHSSRFIKHITTQGHTVSSALTMSHQSVNPAIFIMTDSGQRHCGEGRRTALTVTVLICC